METYCSYGVRKVGLEGGPEATGGVCAECLCAGLAVKARSGSACWLAHSSAHTLHSTIALLCSHLTGEPTNGGLPDLGL